ncbi:6-pyruvoyl-tetrahydropterin synthase-related protein [Paraburkholderia sp. BL10I2N1]|uniref:6-pyruvoyl-tetrahydropterin synthase-related protein n=1 Tax=Paraburkholderia sp. BL10I2N1 TaxID=1938796 RepID=UPI001414FD7F|nr:6-pyruvoyl-tetrahydropterin synthase-related protein [Paraburkholderia sp. BL10I2N1]
MNQVPHPNSLPPQPRLLSLLADARLVPGRRLLVCTAGVALLGYVVAILFGPILRGPDTYTSFSHLYIWTAALKAGDALSTWTPVDANGFGSPVPFFYHKLFNLVGATLALASGDLVTGFRLAALVFSALMFAGVYTCAGRFGADRISGLVIATASVLAPYIFGKLAVSGSAAEYSAATLVPFVIAITIDAYTRRFGKWHGVALLALLLLLTQAHVLVFVIALGVLFPALLYLVLSSPRTGWLPFVITTTVMAVFVTLIYVPFSFWSTFFSPQQAFAMGHMADLLIPPRDIFWRSPRSSFGWPVFALMIGMAFTVFRPNQLKDERIRIAFVLGCIAFGVILMMTRLTRPFWELSGPLEFIQLPWRLLSIAAPICLVAIAGLIEQFSMDTKRRVQLALLVFAMVNAVRMINVASQNTGPIPGPELRREVPTASIVGPDAGGEYFPNTYRQQLAGVDLWKKSAASILPEPRPLVEASGCVYTDIPRSAYFDTLLISATCPAEGHVRINQFSTPFLESVAVDAQGHAIRPLAESQFIEFDLPAGHWTVVVRKQGYLDLLIMAWRAKLSKLGLLS